MGWEIDPIADTPADLYALLPEVAVEVPGCAENMQKAALRRYAQRFCRDTEIWLERLAPTTTASMTSVELNALVAASYDAEVLRVKQVWFPDNGRFIYESQYRLEPSGEDLTMTFIADGIDTALVVNTEDGNMEIQVIVNPDDGCASYPAWLLQRWGKAIVDGALGYLMAQGRKPWTDRDSAMMHKEEYEQAVGEAKEYSTMNRLSGEVCAEPRLFV
jgi:hypothetical protein